MSQKRKTPAKEDQWQTIEFYLKRNPDKTREECEALRRARLDHARDSKANMPKYYQDKYPDKTPEECEAMCEAYKKAHNRGCIEYYQDRFPNKTPEEQQAMLEEFQKDQNSKRPNHNGENNPAHHSRTTEEQRKQRSPMCIEYWNWKYPNNTPEENKTLLNEHQIKIKEKLKAPEKNVHRKEYWTNKGYSEKEAIQKVSDSQRTFSKTICIKKYGLVEGMRIFNERQQKWMKSLRKNFEENGFGSGNQSEFASYIITSISKKLGISIPKKKKYFTNPETQEHYAYDFNYKNILIEFNGDYWHMTPLKYKPMDFNKQLKLTAAQIWDNDIRKMEYARSLGYDILIIWEHEIRYDLEGTIQRCVDFIKEHIKK